VMSANLQYKEGAVPQAQIIEATVLPSTSLHSPPLTGSSEVVPDMATVVTTAVSEPPAGTPTYVPHPPGDGIKRVVDIFENHRYSPRLGFAAKGLLLTDRGNFSTDEGDVSYNSLEAAEPDMLTYGWTWDPQSEWQLISTVSQGQYNPATAPADEGWLYNADFSSYSQETHQGAVQKGMTHFVRRRRWVRTQIFVAGTILNDDSLTCQSCDLEQVEALQKLLLEKFWQAIYVKYGGSANRHKFNKLKNKLIEATRLISRGVRSLSVQQVGADLDKFIRSLGNKSVGAFDIHNPNCKLLVDGFTAPERIEIAKVIVRSFDSTHEYHCTNNFCGQECPYAVHSCPNGGCTTSFSMNHWLKHDAVCPFKPIACPLNCGHAQSRQTMSDHVQTTCVMRPVLCPYHSIGCRPEGLIARDSAQHVELNHAYHLALAMAVVQRLSEEKAELDKRVFVLSQENSTLKASRASG